MDRQLGGGTAPKTKKSEAARRGARFAAAAGIIVCAVLLIPIFFGGASLSDYIGNLTLDAIIVIPLFAVIGAGIGWLFPRLLLPAQQGDGSDHEPPLSPESLRAEPKVGDETRDQLDKTGFV